MDSPLTIGWRERIDLPEWGIERTRAKIDTGAKTSSIDAEVIELITQPDGTARVRLSLRLSRDHPRRRMIAEAPVVRTTLVKNTNCQAEYRLVISTTLQLGPIWRTIELTIANRKQMLVPIILGRTALGDDVRVDASRKYLLTGRKQV